MDILGIKILEKCKDGGPESPVDAYVLVECKALFSLLVLKFNKGRRETYHNHAFDALTWFIKGSMVEERLTGDLVKLTPYCRSLVPKFTKRDNMHRVKAYENSWCLTLRGAWRDTWQEYNEQTGTRISLTHGRVECQD